MYTYFDYLVHTKMQQRSEIQEEIAANGVRIAAIMPRLRPDYAANSIFTL